MINRRNFLKAAGASIATGMLPGNIVLSAEVRRPNIILIMTDDQGFGDVGIHGNDKIDTPVLDTFARQGARLNRFFVSPVCAPTRASLLTGRYHLRCGVHGVTRTAETMRSEEVTIAEILKKAGYKTGIFGKWHNGAHWPEHPNGQGFDEFLGFCAGHWNNYFDTKLEYNGQEVNSKGYIADVFTSAAMHFISTNRERPFFCYIPYNPPHGPFQVPDSYFNKYKQRGLDDRLACIYGMCENIDDNVGKILEHLKRMKLEENTIVIFMTDNGPNGARYNDDMKGTKGSIHEGGGRVPCFIRWPGKINKGLIIDKIAAHIDILPTLVELTGVEMGDTLPLDGISIAPLLFGNELGWRDRMLFTHWGNKGAVRTQQYRLAVYPNRVELYDMIADPSEKFNLVRLRQDITSELKKAYDKWYKDVTAGGLEPIPTKMGYPEAPTVTLPGHEAFLYPENGIGISYVGVNGWANDWVTNWTDEKSYPFWEVEVVQGGEYEISLMYTCSEENLGSKVRVEFGKSGVEGVVSSAHDPKPLSSPDRVKRGEVYEKVWAEMKIGKVRFEKGRGKLAVKCLSKPGNVVMDLKAVKITKID